VCYVNQTCIINIQSYSEKCLGQNGCNQYLFKSYLQVFRVAHFLTCCTWWGTLTCIEYLNYLTCVFLLPVVHSLIDHGWVSYPAPSCTPPPLSSSCSLNLLSTFFSSCGIEVSTCFALLSSVLLLTRVQTSCASHPVCHMLVLLSFSVTSFYCAAATGPRSCHEHLSVCLFVRPSVSLSNAWIVTERRNFRPHSYTIRKVDASNFLTQNGWWGMSPFTWNFGPMWPTPLQKRRFPMHIRW